MSRGSGTRSADGSGSGSRKGNDGAALEARGLAAHLRDLAERAECDPALAARLRDALRASGLLDDAALTHPRRTARVSTPSATSTARRGRRQTGVAGDEPPDPFVLLRERGEAGLRAALDGLDLAALRAIVRDHRLDPARISARWTVRERVIELIVQQVRGRANLGKAFARV